MSTPISKEIRSIVKERANGKCEYCGIHEAYSFLPFQIDHIIAQKHGGSHDLTNLAYSCPHCNQHKGSDISTYLTDKQIIIRLYNPRIDKWDNHFFIELGAILSETDMGKGTVSLLKFNQAERLMTRQILLEEGLYP